jgi:Tfp pilus assembly protein PilF
VVHYELAIGYWRLRRIAQADRELHQALALAPQYAEAYLALSAIPMVPLFARLPELLAATARTP